VIAASTIIGLLMNYVNIDPIKALIYTAVINGVSAVPILFVVMKISNDKKLLRENSNRRISNIIGWSTFIIMAVSVLVLFFTWSYQH
jgi:Mn2+/Fe2+ NRAMP family transporter